LKEEWRRKHLKCEGIRILQREIRSETGANRRLVVIKWAISEADARLEILPRRVHQRAAYQRSSHTLHNALPWQVVIGAAAQQETAAHRAADRAHIQRSHAVEPGIAVVPALRKFVAQAGADRQPARHVLMVLKIAGVNGTFHHVGFARALKRQALERHA